MDTVSPARRSYIMSRVPQRNTRPEKKVRTVLHMLGYRFRLHRKTLPGTPDIVLPRFKTALFVHSCFFHGHANCRKARLPTSNIDYWQHKVAENMERDRKVVRDVGILGWSAMTVWQCETEDPARLARKLKAALSRARTTSGRERG